MLSSNFKVAFSFFFGLCLLSACLPRKKQNSLFINGAGASFPYILYSKWLSEYRKVEPSVAINYQSIGSGGGIRQFMTGTLDFGGTDIPVSKEELKGFKKEILHIPTTLGAVAITYNLDVTTKKPLKLTGEVLSEIFTGKISHWTDPKIKALNPKISLPEKDIVVIYRADGSGTTQFFTEYLSLLSKDFLKQVGKGKSVAWPVGLGGKGNEGIMGLVNKINGAIAYIGVSYAVSQKLPMARVKNSSGEFIAPSLNSIKASAKQAMKSKKMTKARSLIFQEKPLTLWPVLLILLSLKRCRKKRGKLYKSFYNGLLRRGKAFPSRFTLFLYPLW